MAKTSLRLDTRRALKDGTYPVQVRVGYGTNLYLGTGIHIKKEDWNEQNQICTGRNARRINLLLDKALYRVEERLLEWRCSGNDPARNRGQLRRLLIGSSADGIGLKNPSLGDCLHQVIRLKRGSTRCTYLTLGVHLAAHGRMTEIPIGRLSYAWFESFKRHLEEKGLSCGTISKYLKALKTVAKYAEDEGLPVHPSWRRVYYRADDETLMRNLPIETLRQIRDRAVKGSMACYRDAFLLSFYLIGINPTDLLNLPKDCIVNGRLLYRRAKTGRHYSIRVEPEAWEIIGRYPGETHLLSFAEKVKHFRQDCNRLLKQLEPGLTWYWARYTWANLAVDLDIPKDIISEALGHKHGSDITGVYIRYSLDKVDRANRQVLDYFADPQSAKKQE